MASPIIYDRDIGLRQGIQQAGGALNQALQQRAASTQKQAFIDKIMNMTKQQPSFAPGNVKEEFKEEMKTVDGRTGLDMNVQEIVSKSSPFSLPYSNEQVLAASALDPNLARGMEAANKTAIEEQKLQQKEQAQIRKEDRQEIREYAKDFRDIDKLRTSVSKLEKAKDLIKNKKVSLDENQYRRLTTAILEDKGYDTVAQYFKTDDQKRLFALLKDFFKTKDVGGSNPSTKEVLLSLSTLPSENLGYEANLDLVNTLLEDAQGKLFKGEKISEIRKSGKQMNFGEFQDTIQKFSDQRLNPLREQYKRESKIAQQSKIFRGKTPRSGYVFALDSNGQPGEIPKSKIKSFKESGGTVINDN